MAKKKETTKELINKSELGLTYLKSLEQDSIYQINVDPDNFYKMTAEHKQFIELFIQYRNLSIVTELMNLTYEKAKEYFLMYSTQQEIRRINTALYHRQIATNIIGFEDIGRYLSSWLIGADIPDTDKLKPSEKIQVAKLLLDWHKQMKDFIDKPEIITAEVIEEQIKDLSVENIKQLIKTNSLIDINKASKEKIENKEELIEELNKTDLLSKDELDYLNTLSIKELINLIKDE